MDAKDSEQERNDWAERDEAEDTQLEGTALTTDRADALERLADQEDLTADDHANLAGLADDLANEAMALAQQADQGDQGADQLMEAAGALRSIAEQHRQQEATDQWAETLEALQQHNPAYGQGRPGQVTERLQASRRKTA